VARQLERILLFAGFAFLIAYGMWGRWQQPSVQASLLAALFAAGAGYSFLKLTFTTDRFQARGPVLPHAWWAVVGVIWTATAVVAIAQGLGILDLASFVVSP
jgi:hypothetical protein